MGDVKDSKKIQSDRAAKKLKEKEQAKRLRPDTATGKPAGDMSVPQTPSTPNQTPRKKGSK